MNPITRGLERAETVIYTAAGVLLAFAALVILGHTMVAFVRHVLHGEMIRYEIGLLAVTILILVVCIFILRRSTREPRDAAA